jgi:hypothetical protein
MVTERRAPRAQVQSVAGVMKLFARAARARQIYNENNAVLARMRHDLESAFVELLKSNPEVSLKVRADSFLFEDEPVLEEPNPDESIPFAFYRDGIRKLDFHRGLSRPELDVLIAATAQGFSFSGLGDDIVAYLWRHELEHVRYVVVDTTIVDAAQLSQAAAGAETAAIDDVDAQIDGLLRSIYGSSSDDVGPKSVHVDASDLSAKVIAEQLDVVDEMAPGFHPPRAFLHAPAYQIELSGEISRFADRDIALRAMFAGFWAFQASPGGATAEAIAEAMLRAYDTALIEEDLSVATYLVRGMTEMSSESRRAREWLDVAIDEARLRQVSSILLKSRDGAGSQDVFPFFRACGPRAVPLLVGQLPSLTDPLVRRCYSDLILELGVEAVDVIRPLLTSEQAFVSQEAVYILGKMRGDEAVQLLEHASEHPHGQVRLAFVEHLPRLPVERRQEAAVRLLGDEDDRIRIAAAKALATIRNEQTALVMKEIIRQPEFAAWPYPVKEAFLDTYAQLHQVWSLRFLTKFVKNGAAMLAKAEDEDLAVAAAKALRHVPTQRTVDCLEGAAKSRRKKVRETAQTVLQGMKGARTP